MSELDEMREKIAWVFINTFPNGVQDIYKLRVDAQRFAHQILSLETAKCRLAVVRKEAELPRLKSLGGEATLEEKAAFTLGMEAVEEEIRSRGFVREVKDVAD